MSIEELIKWTDDLVFAKTGKHLESVHTAILEGTWKGHKYQEIADCYNYTEDHLKKEGSELWKLLSILLKENVKKSNFRATVQKLIFSKISNSVNCVQIGATNICSQNKESPTPDTTPNTPEKRHDLTEAPDIDTKFDRTSEISTLKQWIQTDRTRIITLLGLSGIGKTALALQLIKHSETDFDNIIWRSLNNYPTLEALLTSLIKFFTKPQPLPSQAEDHRPLTTQLIDYLRFNRTLLILDDIQTIFSTQELAGNYQPNYRNYSTFFKQIAEASHHSCLLLLTWEKPTDIATLEAKNPYVKTLQLNGLGDRAWEIFQNRQLTNQNRWQELIDFYSTNPLWLNIVADMIKNLFNGNVAAFLDCESNFLGDLEPLLEQHWQRLSDSEKLIMSWLANQDTGVEVTSKNTNLQLSTTEILKAIQSLGRRCLIEKVEGEERSIFTLGQIIKQYVRSI